MCEEYENPIDAPTTAATQQLAQEQQELLLGLVQELAGLAAQPPQMQPEEDLRPADVGDVLNIFGGSPPPADVGDVLNILGTEPGTEPAAPATGAGRGGEPAAGMAPDAAGDAAGSAPSQEEQDAAEQKKQRSAEISSFLSNMQEMDHNMNMTLINNLRN